MNAALHPFSLPLTSSISTGGSEISRREGFLLEWDGDQHTGFGEATPLPGWTESFRACELTLATARDALVDDDPAAAMAACTDHPATRHAVDLAVLDHRSRRAAVGLHQYLGGGPDPDPVPVNATIPDGPVSATRDAATAAVEAGYSCLKVKTGARTPRTDGERVAAVRGAIPDSTRIRVDANGAWTHEETLTFLESVELSTLAYLEQPLASEDLEGHASLRDQGIPVALDESVRDHGIDAVLAADAADVVVLKPMAIGGIERTREMATTATAAGLDPVLSTTMDAAVARTAATQIAASLADPLPAGLATGDRFETNLLDASPRIVDGDAHLPEGNGNGVTPTSQNDA